MDSPQVSGPTDEGSPDATLISARSSEHFAPAPSMAELGRSMEGRSLGPYRLLEFVGGGGMGAVFRALDSTLDRIVAVKVLSHRQSSDEEMLKRFRNEAQSAARLDHENIGRVYAVGSDGGWHYIVFEYIDGTNLRDVITQGGPFDLGRTIDVTIQLADALEHASQRDVVHRDIKPSNIIITPAGRARIVDMGLARLHQVAGDNDLTASGMTLGTFDYISPEQARDPRDADVRSDLYSLGCTVHFMLTGRPPFADGTMVQKLLQHQQDEPPAIESLRPDLPRGFGEILRRLMRKDPADRYQRPADLITDLLSFADDNGIDLVSPRPIVIPPAAPQEPVHRGKNWLVAQLPWLLPAVAFGLLVAGLWMWPRWDRSEPVEEIAPRAATRADADGTAPWRVVDAPAAAMERGSLTEAVHAAADGDVIELAYSGMHDEPPLMVESKRISIRAAEGFRPGVRFTAGLPVPEASAEGRAGFPAPQRQAACLIDAGSLRIEGIFVQSAAAPRGDGVATTLFAIRGPARLECIDTRLQLLRGFDVDAPETIGHPSVGDDAFVEFLPAGNASDSTTPHEIRVIRSTVEGDANFLMVRGTAPVEVVWSESRLIDASRFLVAEGTEPTNPRGPRVRLALDNGLFECREAFVSLRDSPSRPAFPTLQCFAESSRFRIAAGKPLLEQAGIADPDAYRIAIEWLDAGGRYEGSPVFRRIDGAAERVEIDYASAPQTLRHMADAAEWGNGID